MFNFHLDVGVSEMVVPNNHGFSYYIKMIILECFGGTTI